MKFEGSGSKGTRVIERKQSVTDGQTARRTDGQGKNNMSPPEGGGRHNHTTCAPYPCLPVELCATLVLDDEEGQVNVEVVGPGPSLQDDAVLTQVQAHAAAHLLFTEQGTDFN